MPFEYRALGLRDSGQFFRLVNEIKDEGKYLFASLRFSEEDTERYIAGHAQDGPPIIGAFGPEGLLVGWIDYNRGGFPEIEHTATLARWISSSSGAGERGNS